MSTLEARPVYSVADPLPIPRSGVSRLTLRHRQMLHLIGKYAMGQKALAEELGISPRTIDNHLCIICSKLGVPYGSRLTALAIIAVRTGLADGEFPLEDPAE